MMRANSAGKLLRLKPEEFRMIRDLVNAYAGLHFGDDALVIFDRRLSDRVAALQLSGFDEYYKYLRFNLRGPAELEEVLERLITTETYFFRQEYQLRAFSRTKVRGGCRFGALAAQRAKKCTPLRFWFTNRACSTVGK